VLLELFQVQQQTAVTQYLAILLQQVAVAQITMADKVVAQVLVVVFTQEVEVFQVVQELQVKEMMEVVRGHHLVGQVVAVALVLLVLRVLQVVVEQVEQELHLQLQVHL
jgi:hypothetical protein